MSHIVTIEEIEVKDFDAIAAACRRLGLKEPIRGTAKLYKTTVEGIVVELTDWHFPIVCDENTGKVQYDNYEGGWGDRKHLDSFIQSYSVEKATLEARKNGYSVYEQAQQDGSIKLHISLGGAT